MARRLGLRRGVATLTTSALLGGLAHTTGDAIGEKDASTATTLAKALGRL